MTDIKGLMPYFIEEMAKGRTIKEIAAEKGFSSSAYQNMVYYLNMDNRIQKHKEEVYTIRPEKPKKVETFVQDGKVWYDVTPFLIDCGG